MYSPLSPAQLFALTNRDLAACIGDALAAEPSGGTTGTAQTTSADRATNLDDEISDLAALNPARLVTDDANILGPGDDSQCVQTLTVLRHPGNWSDRPVRLSIAARQFKLVVPGDPKEFNYVPHLGLEVQMTNPPADDLPSWAALRARMAVSHPPAPPSEHNKWHENLDHTQYGVNWEQVLERAGIQGGHLAKILGPTARYTQETTEEQRIEIAAAVESLFKGALRVALAGEYDVVENPHDTADYTAGICAITLVQKEDAIGQKINAFLAAAFKLALLFWPKGQTPERLKSLQTKLSSLSNKVSRGESLMHSKQRITLKNLYREIMSHMDDDAHLGRLPAQQRQQAENLLDQLWIPREIDGKPNTHRLANACALIRAFLEYAYECEGPNPTGKKITDFVPPKQIP